MIALCAHHYVDSGRRADTGTVFSCKHSVTDAVRPVASRVAAGRLSA
jgi:hypothetical protein